MMALIVEFTFKVSKLLFDGLLIYISYNKKLVSDALGIYVT